MPTSAPIISIKHLNVTYFAGKSNEVKALQDISLEIFQGQFIIFFGPSGCGKSTLLYSIAGLERNVEGSIVVKGKDLIAMKPKELEAYHQKVIGMIFQSFYLIDSLTIIENVALPQVGIHGEKSERIKKAGALLEKFGVGAQAHKLSHELSGGQQQRVAISRSLINEPDILIADEPVGNLDSKSSQDVMDLLRHLNDNDKKTVILVTHDPSHLRHANRVFYIRDGKITGTKDNTEEERNQSTAASISSPISAASLTHWARAYAPTSEEEKKEFNLIQQAQQILTEVLTGMDVAEVQAIDQANKIFSIVQIVLALFGFVALIVSAIGMFNTMTITLLERTNEIGIMRAIGITRFDIRVLFLVESMFMGFLGGLGGVLIGTVAGWIANLVVNLLASRFGGPSLNLFYTPWWFIVVIIGFSAFIGFVTGIYPSRRASRLNPLDALRYK